VTAVLKLKVTWRADETARWMESSRQKETETAVNLALAKWMVLETEPLTLKVLDSVVLTAMEPMTG
jgi:hypothetical protein